MNRVKRGRVTISIRERSARAGGWLCGALLLCSASLFVTPALSRAQSTVPVYVVGLVDENDHVGRQFVFEVREAIRGSQGLRLVEDGKEWPYIKVVVTTVSAAAATTAAGYAITYDSIDMPFGGGLLFSGVQACGRERVSSCARSVLANLGDAIRNLQRVAPDVAETLR